MHDGHGGDSRGYGQAKGVGANGYLQSQMNLVPEQRPTEMRIIRLDWYYYGDIMNPISQSGGYPRGGGAFKAN